MDQDIFYLPEEIWNAILTHLNTESLMTMCCVNRYFSVLASDDQLWFEQCFNLISKYMCFYPLPERLESCSYKKYFFTLRRIATMESLSYNHNFNLEKINLETEEWNRIDGVDFKHNVWNMCNGFSDGIIGSLNSNGVLGECDNHLKGVACYERCGNELIKFGPSALRQKELARKLQKIASDPYNFVCEIVQSDMDNESCAISKTRFKYLSESDFLNEFEHIGPSRYSMKTTKTNEHLRFQFLCSMIVTKFLEPVFHDAILRANFQIHDAYPILSRIIFKVLNTYAISESIEAFDIDDQEPLLSTGPLEITASTSVKKLNHYIKKNREDNCYDSCNYSCEELFDKVQLQNYTIFMRKILKLTVNEIRQLESTLKRSSKWHNLETRISSFMTSFLKKYMNYELVDPSKNVYYNPEEYQDIPSDSVLMLCNSFLFTNIQESSKGVMQRVRDILFADGEEEPKICQINLSDYEETPLFYKVVLYVSNRRAVIVHEINFNGIFIH